MASIVIAAVVCGHNLYRSYKDKKTEKKQLLGVDGYLPDKNIKRTRKRVGVRGRVDRRQERPSAGRVDVPVNSMILDEDDITLRRRMSDESTIVA